MTGDDWFKDGAALAIGLLGLLVSWWNNRADRPAKRLDRLVSIEADAIARGPLRSDGLDVLGKHQAFLMQLDEEIRIQQQQFFATARRAGSGVSTGFVLVYALYGGFLVWEGIEIDSGPRPVPIATMILSWAFAIVGACLLLRAVIMAVRRWSLRRARRAIGLFDPYSRAAFRNAIQRVRSLWS